jgi:Flp pilus assembly protein TadG
MSLHRQKGSSLVEMAIVLLLFLMIIFTVIEFSIAIFRSAQLADATGAGLRYAIVNDPLTELSACTSSPTPTFPPVNCGSGSCPGLIERMANIAPIISTQGGINVTVKYTCPVSGYIDDGIYLVTVTVSGAKHYLTVPGVLGLDVPIDLQTFKSTRLSEDLHTPVPGGG